MHHGALWTNKCSYVAVKNTNSIQSCNSRGRLHFLLVNLKFDSKMNRIRCGPQKQKIINACEKNPSLKEAVLHGPITSHFSESKMNHFSNLLQPDKKFEQIWSSLQATFPMKRLSFQSILAMIITKLNHKSPPFRKQKMLYRNVLYGCLGVVNGKTFIE